MSRDGSKEITLDYIDAFKERRGIVSPIDRAVLRPDQPYRDAVDRYAIAYLDVARMDGSPAIYQTARLDKAGQELERARPGTLAILQSAFVHDMNSRIENAELRGDKRVDMLIAAIAKERTALANPMVRAQRFNVRWQAEVRAFTATEHNYRRIDEHEQAKLKLVALSKELVADKPMMSAIKVDPDRLKLHPQSALLRAVHDSDPVYSLRISIGQGFAPPSQSRGFSR